ncbi:regulatory protein RecX [Microvirga puerhi]|uniref:Regulatory protein RecX n=1 Tax=Microvirga puerhi TaxID=2876078 RepID=A0ABS7VQB5_9HYPH|nr:RecX family transcriptional regulator [Microvirga puerhi]MBZ6077157.1 RecX family transcriptional regulator [Microvirga puerhi]
MTDDERKPARKPPRKITPAYLQRAAMAYLERYASSAENLRRVLRRKVENRCRLRGEDPAEFSDAIDEVVARSLRAGLIDDTRYAEARLASLRRRGGSTRSIRAKLALKGVDRDTIATVMAGEEEGADQEEQAARALARRRRIGPFRLGERAPYRDKDLAILARAGFPFTLARRVIDGDVTGEDET